MPAGGVDRMGTTDFGYERKFGGVGQHFRFAPKIGHKNSHARYPPMTLSRHGFSVGIGDAATTARYELLPRQGTV